MHPLPALARAFFPHFCLGCNAEGVVLCAACRLKLRPANAAAVGAAGAAAPSEVRTNPTPHLDAVLSVLPYNQPLPRRLLQQFKYERIDEARREAVVAFAAHVSARSEPAEWARHAFVLAVPMHPVRAALRGFNQADDLAAAFARATGARLATKVLQKRFRLKRQAELDSPVARRRNAKNSIVLRRRFPPGSRFVLVDDVFTTGATLDACAAVLRRAGAAEVRAVTFLQG